MAEPWTKKKQHSKTGKRSCHKQPVLPTECGSNDRFTNAELMEWLPQFKDAWHKHPAQFSKLGANHMFAEWFLVKKLKPTAIIESGVLQGGATWGLRDAAGPDTPIFSFDPVDNTKHKKGFHDSNANTKYFFPPNWKDLSEVDWDTVIPMENRSTALVILDDHQIFFDRFKTLKEAGFKHIFVEDNNAYGNGNTSPNFFCTKADLWKDTYKEWNITDASYHSPWGDVTDAKTAGTRANKPLQARSVTWEQHAENMEFVQKNMKHYYEFPAVWDVCHSRSSEWELVHDAQELAKYGMPTKADREEQVFDHRFPPYIEIA